nr:MAG: ORF1 [TTV-like mini virus]
MPLYRRRFYYRRKRRPYRRLRPKTWRTRRPFRPTFWRRRWVRKRYRKYKRKLSKITVKQWQPKTIHNCTIKGLLPVFVCGRTRICHNYTLYAESTSREGEPTGGSWSYIQFTLKALYSLFLKYRNWWTKSNQGLPLTRYIRSHFKFYRADYIDYIVTWSICPPFSVTEEMYLNAQPSRQLMNKNKLIVPCMQNRTFKKPYRKLRLHPPSLLKTKWYFTQDICSFPLVIFCISACSLEQFYAPENQIGTDITLTSLNTDFFQNPQFATHDTDGYSPKTVSGNNFKLWGAQNGGEHTKAKGLVPLWNTRTLTKGIVTSSYTETIKSENWGNIFHPWWADSDRRVYYSTNTPTDTSYENLPVSQLHEIFFKVRYNPYTDNGTGNKVFWKSTSLDRTNILTPPNKPELTIENYPLWLIFFSWSDWIEKLKPINQKDQNYFLVVITPYFVPKRAGYVLLDNYFVYADHEKLNVRDQNAWHPKYEMQTEQEYFLGQSGPGAPKINRSQCVQAKMLYSFKLKWGGCPAPMEIIDNPCDQDKFPVPNKEQQGPSIESPTTPKEYYLYDWDQRAGLITKKCAKRIKKDSDVGKSFTGGSTLDLQVQAQTSEDSETETEEEAQTPLQQQLQQLRYRQRQLKLQLYKLAKRQKLE